MDELQVLPLKRTYLTSQKILMSRANIDNFNLHIAKYAVISYLKSKYICKVYERNDITDQFCYVDASVETIQTADDNIPSKMVIDKDSIIECPSLISFNYIYVDVIFDTIDQSIKWKNDPTVLANILKKYVLKSFVISANCKVDLTNIKFMQNLGLKKIFVRRAEFDLTNAETNIMVLGRVTNNTKIKIMNIYTSIEYKRILKYSNTKIIGAQSEFLKLVEIIEINRHIVSTNQTTVKPPKQILIIGPPGTGKTTLIYTIATKMKIPVISVFGSELFKKDPGESEKELRNLFHNAFGMSTQNSMCILLLDGLENICPTITANTGIHVSRICAQLLLLLDEANLIPSLIIFGITRNSRLLHPSIRRPGRMDSEVYIRLPDANDRMEIFVYYFENLFPNLINSSEIHELSEAVSFITAGYTGSDIELLFQKVILHINRTERYPQNSQQWDHLFKLIVQNSYPISGKSIGIKTNESTLSNIGGSDKIIATLRRCIEWPIKHPDIFRKMGLAQPKGLLMYGPPGCAKTTLARAIAKEVNYCFFSISAAQLYSPYVGITEGALISVFEQARQSAPSIVFIDEIDAIVGTRSSGTGNQNDVQNRLLSTLLMEMDGVGNSLEYKLKNNHLNDIDNSCSSGIFVIAATNRPDAIDSALMRPGRFDKILYVPPPDRQSRLEILKKITSNIPLASDVDLESLSHRTVNYSGADLVMLCKEATLEAMTSEGLDISEVKFKYFEIALSKNKSSLTKAQISWYENFKI